MLKLVIIGLGGFAGAVGRYALTGLAHRLWSTTFPIGTLVVNVAGCFLLGAVMYLVQSHGALSPNTRLFITIGILGAFTTFSTFGYETLALIDDREFLYALWNVVGNLMLGLAAVWLGRLAVRVFG
jgi:fluoride exporter